jgi:hypothetical protein
MVLTVRTRRPILPARHFKSLFWPRPDVRSPSCTSGFVVSGRWCVRGDQPAGGAPCAFGIDCGARLLFALPRRCSRCRNGLMTSETARRCAGAATWPAQAPARRSPAWHRHRITALRSTGMSSKNDLPQGLPSITRAGQRRMPWRTNPWRVHRGSGVAQRRHSAATGGEPVSSTTIAHCAAGSAEASGASAGVAAQP